MGGVGNPNFFLHISFSWVEIRLHTEFQLPMLHQPAHDPLALLLPNAAQVHLACQVRCGEGGAGGACGGQSVQALEVSCASSDQSDSV